MDFNLRQHTHLLTVAGSRAYGIHTETSDVDMAGVAIPPKEYTYGFLKKFDQAVGKSHFGAFAHRLHLDEARASVNGLEGVIYDLRKFMKLASDCNPNILDVLFCRDDEVRLMTPTGEWLRDRRDWFLSQKAKHTFSGYAMSQLKRIRGHRNWLLSPPTAPPSRSDFGLPERTVIPADQRGAALSLVKKRMASWDVDLEVLDKPDRLAVKGELEAMMVELQLASDTELWQAAARTVGLSDNFIDLLERERGYRAAMGNWKQYQNWKTSRNPARAALEEKYGYDTKHGGHLVRLMNMGLELLQTGELNVWRGDIDAEFILSVRAGHLPYDELIQWAEDREALMDEAVKTSPLPKRPNRKKLDELCVQLIESNL